MNIKLLLACAASAAAVACSAAPAGARLPQIDGSVDLAGYGPNTVLDGERGGDSLGTAVADAGDVNGDGIRDALVTALNADANGRRDSGSAWVVFGRADGASIDLGHIPAGGGFRIDGAAPSDHLGYSAAAAGDVNGDGLADVVVGARDADNRGRGNSGSAYVIFGRTATSAVDTANLGGAGFRIDGSASNDRAGSSVSGGRDFDGDGRPDLLVTAPQADRNARTNSGTAYVVYGKSSADGVDLAALGSAGYPIDGAQAGDQLGTAASTRDVTGDGVADILVGARFADGAGRVDSGAVYVLAGHGGTTATDLAAPGAAYYTGNGAAAGDAAGAALAQGGDLDGDGRGDLLVGAPGTDYNGRAGSGSAYVLLGAGSGGVHDLGALDSTWRVDGAVAGEAAGTSVDAGADVNSDGRTDLAVGSPLATRNGRATAGSVRVLYGGGFSGVVDLATTDADGFRADGAGAGDQAGNSVALLPDVTGDGWSDLLVGTPGADRLGRGNSGSTYILWGFGTTQLQYPGLLDGTVTRPIAPLAPQSLVRTGVPSFSISPALPDGLALDARTGVISGAPTAIQEQPLVFTLTMTDFGGSVSAPVLLRVAPLPGACTNVRIGTDQPDQIEGTSGGDRISPNSGSDTVEGLAGDDCVNGDAGSDSLDGGDGNDELHGGIDPDHLDGGRGDDRLYGDAGQDDISGGPGDDYIDGGLGFDEIQAGDGNDRVAGGAASDVIYGGNGNDRLDGGGDADKLVGGRGDDVLIGGSGNDIISDSSGSNKIVAGAGSDSIDVRNGRRDVVSCGPGKDRVSADRIDKLKGCERVSRPGAKKHASKKRKHRRRG